MTTDIQTSLMTALYNLLTADATLQTAMGGTVRLYPVWAKKDADFPYLVHRIDMRHADWNPVIECTYLIDAWSYSTNATAVVAIKNRIVALLDNRDSSTTETTNYHTWIQTETFVPESTDQIFHYAMQFNLKWTLDANIGTLLYR
jgi:hypothetical protein